MHSSSALSRRGRRRCPSTHGVRLLRSAAGLASAAHPTRRLVEPSQLLQLGQPRKASRSGHVVADLKAPPARCRAASADDPGALCSIRTGGGSPAPWPAPGGHEAGLSPRPPSATSSTAGPARPPRPATPSPGNARSPPCPPAARAVGAASRRRQIVGERLPRRVHACSSDRARRDRARPQDLGSVRSRDRLSTQRDHPASVRSRRPERRRQAKRSLAPRSTAARGLRAYALVGIWTIGAKTPSYIRARRASDRARPRTAGAALEGGGVRDPS